jgi:phospholipase C
MATRSSLRAFLAILCGAGIAAGICSCMPANLPTAPGGAVTPLERTRALRSDIDTIVIIYAENRAFDNLYGNFPGARNLSEVIDRDGHPLSGYHPQLDRDGSVLSVLPPTWGGVTAAGVTPVVTQQQSVGLPNAPYSIEQGFTRQSQATLSTATAARTTATPPGRTPAVLRWGTTTTAVRRCTRWPANSCSPTISFRALSAAHF